MRQTLGFSDSCRVVFGESDGLPGLTVDKFADCLSFQIACLGLEQWKETLVEILAEIFAPRGIYERDDLPVREKEGLPQIKACVYGTVPEEIVIREHDARMLVCIENGQKTGHFLDQQENRGRLKPYAPGQDVLDLCCCTGGFSIHAALYGAAQRGVRVRVIVDGLNGFLHLQNSGVLRALAAEENVEVKFYDPIDLLRPWKLNYRLHDKYLIADGSKYILGGRNSNDLFLGSYQENQNIDRDVLVVSDGGEGSSVSQLLTYFESAWSQPENQTITGKTSSQTDALQERYAALCAVHGKELAAVDWEVETAAVTHVSLLSGSPRAEAKAPELWDALVRLMAQGDDVLLQTPYIICNDKMYNDLEALAETRQLRVLTNAVENGANPSGCSDYLREKQNILSRGVDVYEVVCGQSLHTKTILIGDDLSIVGSFNADMRSAYLDTELMLVIESEEVNAALRQESVQYIDQSRLALHDGGTEYGARFEEMTLPWAKRALYTILSVVQRPIRHLL